ncbi:MAG: type I polyketide synthase, partial [Chloroflexota bacterium]
MSRTDQSAEQRALFERALQEIRELRAKVEAYERREAEPIAVLGAGCRFPGGANTPAAYWDLLRRGVDAVTEIPADRWDSSALYDPDPNAAGKVATRFGAFLADVDRFDAAFFHLSPREAASMDPRQRLLLQICWEALEDGGQVPSRLAGSRTGVFVGLFNDDYAQLQLRLDDPSNVTAYSGTGNSHSVAAGRISYVFDFRGPSMAIDTACSSSLTAIGLACQSLRRGECDLALAGGANLILSPLFSMIASRMRMMAADGRCKAFDARADGFVRSEGCGMVALKRLSDALADGDPIRAVVRGVAINQDGRSNGLTAGNGLAQEDVIRRALEDARLSPAAVSYVEAHGTGTPLGDPIEVDALAATYGSGRGQAGICRIGSVKANLGHLEAAAGIAGFLKAVLAIQHGQVPAQLHYQAWNPHIRLDGAPLVVPVRLEDWHPDGGRFAGVSAFGWSGTNVHAVLGEAPAAAPREQRDRLCLLPFSAQTARGAQRLAAGYAALLADTEATWNDICYTASVRREHHPHRGFVVAGSKAEAIEALRDYSGDPDELVALPPDGPRKVVFVFSGQGSQWLGMVRQLYREAPVFRDALERCEAALRPFVDWSLREELSAPEDRSRLAQIDVVQPALFSIQVALAATWQAWGITPDAVIGHSMGEVAAAHVAGALTLEDAARVICRRSRLLRQLSGRGAMAVVELSHEAVQGLLNGHQDRISVGASNSPRSTVLSGDRDALQQVVAGLEARHVACRWIKVDVASHSPQMDSLRDELLRALDGLRPQPARLPICSTVTARFLAGSELTPAYWFENLRRPVLFWPALARLAQDHDSFLEVSPHPVLKPAVEDGLRHLGTGGVALASLRRGEDERATLSHALGRLYQQGVEVDWQGQFPHGGRCVTLPTYPWELERYWLESKSRPSVRPVPSDAAAGSADDLYEIAWRKLPDTASPAEEEPAAGLGQSGCWLVYPDQGGVAARLARELAALGHSCIIMDATTMNATSTSGVRQRALRAAAAPPRGIVYLAGLDAALPALPEILAEIAGAVRDGHGAMPLAPSVPPAPGPQLLLVTRGAQVVDGEDGGAGAPGLAQTPILGFARVIRSELPEVGCRCVD